MQFGSLVLSNCLRFEQSIRAYSCRARTATLRLLALESRTRWRTSIDYCSNFTLAAANIRVLAGRAGSLKLLVFQKVAELHRTINQMP